MQIEQILRDYNSWLYKTANSLSKDSHMVEDLVQEGRIAMWKAYNSYDPDRGPLSPWLMFKARNRMLTSVTSDRWEGTTRVPGSLAAKIPIPVEDKYLNSESCAASESYAIAFHREEIIEAVNTLTPSQRRFVYSKFWLDFITSDFVEEFGSYSSAVSNWYKGTKDKGAKLRLTESLEHLKELV